MAVTGIPTGAQLEQQLRETYQALGGVGEPVVVVLPWEPVAKKRPRFARNGRAYQDAADRAAEEKTRTALLFAVSARWETNVVVVAAFARSDRRLVDTDNCMKHLLDAANNTVFFDDAQVTAQAGILEYDPGAPRTVVLIGEHASSMARDIGASSTRRAKPRGT